MSPRSRDEIVRTVRYHYQRTTRRREKSRLLDEFCRLLACTRKHAIKVLRGQKRAGTTDPGRVRGGPRPRYQAAEKAVLKSLWLLSDQPCGKRLKAVLPWWIRSWERRHGTMDECARQRLLRMSAAQIDRVLKPCKVAGGKRVPRAAADVRSQIPVRSGPWCEEGPGWIEADLRLQSLLDNLFTPTLKLLSKSRDPVSGRLKRHYEKHPCAPAQRALESNALSEESRTSLLAALQRHDPLTLRGAAQGKFEEAWRMQLAHIRASDEPDGKRPASEKIKKS